MEPWEQPVTEGGLKSQQSPLPSGIERLSKWAARLFDPDRPRGLIETPKTIPLNDAILKQFGKREKAHDQALGVQPMTIERKIEDELSADDVYDDEKSSTQEPASKGTKKRKRGGDRKVKISNLSFTTNESSLQAACEVFGKVELTKLLKDENNPNRNRGFAYVTFDDEAGAQACIKGMKTLEGRTLKISTSGEAETVASRNNRYWVTKDLSTKCFRCGQVGHQAASCHNERKAKPCPLCSSTDHDMRACPFKVFCFNCNAPGHVARECSYRMNLPPRRMADPGFGIHDAVCMDCHETGHFMCRSMNLADKVTAPLSCFNCGRRGHPGERCERPSFDICIRNEAMVHLELSRASAYDAHDNNEGNSGSRHHQQQSNGQGRRAKSAPPRNRNNGKRGHRK